MIDLDARLSRGPLRVRSLWAADRGERLERVLLRRRRWLFSLDLLVVGACIVLTVVGFKARGATNAPPLVVASHQATIPQPSTAKFTDGSVADLLGRDSEIRIERDTPNWVVASLSGGARFRVVHNRERTFQVQAGEVRVRVLGTTFSVVQLPSGQTQVLVEQGRVEVAWLGGSVQLETGEGGAFPPADRPLPKEEPPPSGDEMHAAKRAGSTGRDDAADLLLAADGARVDGRPDQAVRLLRDLYDRHPTDRRAPVAAFTAGRILLDDMGRPADAAIAFHRARVLWPQGPLAEDALAREADAWQKAGRLDAARSLAGQYFELYPQGRHVFVLRELLVP